MHMRIGLFCFRFFIGDSLRLGIAQLHQLGWLCVCFGMGTDKPVQFVRLGAGQEPRVDFVHVGYAAPQTVELDAALLGDGNRPFRFQIAHAQPLCSKLQRLFARGPIQRGVERTRQGHLLYDRRIIAARNKRHQIAQSQGMVDQCAQIFAAARALCSFEHPALQTSIDQIAIQRSVIFQINLAAPLGDFVQRRLRDEEVAVFDDFRHLPVEEGEQQSANVGPIDIRIGHDDDLVVAQFLQIKLVANAGAHRLDQRADLFGGNDPVKPGAFHIQDFTLQWQNSLKLAVAAVFGRAASRIALDQKQF